MTTLYDWKYRYDAAGMATIPVHPNRKHPVLPAWQVTPPVEQWAEVGGRAFKGNIGVRPGNGHVVLDADAPAVSEAINQWLEGLGLSDRTLQNTTPGGGTHTHLRARDVPRGFNWSRLAIGPGELRARNAYVVAPCSQVDGRRYSFLPGRQLEAFPGQPELAWVDLKWLVTTGQVDKPDLSAPPVRLVYRPMPERAARLLRWLPDAHKGQSIPKRLSLNEETGELVTTATYASRSEAEAAVVAMLILSGWSFDQIRATFEERQPAHYAAHATNKARLRYLEHVYQRVLTHLATTPERVQVAEWYQQAETADWPGRTGSSERAIYLAVAAKGWQFNTTTPVVSQREIAEHAAMARVTVNRNLPTLVRGGFLQPLRAARAPREPNAYQLYPYEPLPTSNPATTDQPSTTVTNGNSLGISPVREGRVAELWGYNGLLKSGGEVYAQLCRGGEYTVSQLAQLSGRSVKTVKRALLRLAEYGLAQPASESARGVESWRVGEADPRDVAEQLDAPQRAERRRWQHEVEREQYQEMLAMRCWDASRCYPELRHPSTTATPAQRGARSLGGESRCHVAHHGREPGASSRQQEIERLEAAVSVREGARLVERAGQEAL